MVPRGLSVLTASTGVVPIVLLLASFCFSVSLGAEDTADEIAIAVAAMSESGPENRVLIRTFTEPSDVTEFDIFFPHRTVSFVSSFGAGSRGTCNAVFLDADAWFVYCDLYDVQFRSAKELLKVLPRCRGCNSIQRYFVRPDSASCAPVYLGSEAVIGPTPERNRQANRDLALNAALEMSMWAVEDVEALRTALQMVGANGCLRLCSAVIDALGIEAEPIIGEEDIEPVEAVPDEFEGSMDYHRARGLGEWLEDVVARLP